MIQLIRKSQTWRWVNSEKYKNGKIKVKFRLVVGVFSEGNSNVWSGSPTCTQESYA